MNNCRFALGQMFVAVLLLTVATAAEPPKPTAATTPDKAAVVAATLDYIEGYYTGDAARMERSLHPEYVKHTVSQSSGKERLSVKSGLSMVQAARSGEGRGIPKADQREDITVLDLSQNTAAVKLVAAHWTDYLNLVKWNGEWKIVSVLLAEQE